MTFIIIMMLLAGSMFILSAIEQTSLTDTIKKWVFPNG